MMFLQYDVSSICQIINIPERGNSLWQNYRRWIMHENIIYDVWMQITNDLGFSKCAVPLYIAVVIF